MHSRFLVSWQPQTFALFLIVNIDALTSWLTCLCSAKCNKIEKQLEHFHNRFGVKPVDAVKKSFNLNYSQPFVALKLIKLSQMQLCKKKSEDRKTFQRKKPRAKQNTRKPRFGISELFESLLTTSWVSQSDARFQG